MFDVRTRRFRITAKLASIALIYVALLPATALAEDEKDLAILAGLGLTAAEGKTKLGNDGGSLEAMLLMSSLLDTYGQTVRTNTAGVPTGAIIIVASESEKIDLRAKQIFDVRMDLIANRLSVLTPQFVQQNCAPSKPVKPLTPSGGGSEASLDGSTTGVVTALLGALRTDTDITGVKADVADFLLINAITSVRPTNTEWLSLADRQFGDPSLLEGLNNHVGRIDNLLVSCKEKKDIVASLNELKALADGLIAPGKDNSASILEQAVLLSGIDRDKLYVLRIGGTKSGGSLVNRTNIWTTLGFNGTTIRGGLVSGWRLVKALDGTVAGSGIIRCATPALSFGEVHGEALNPKKFTAANSCK